MIKRKPKPNSHKSHGRNVARRSAATTALFVKAAAAYKAAQVLERSGNLAKAAAMYRKASQLLLRANKSGGMEGPVGKLPNPRILRYAGALTNKRLTARAQSFVKRLPLNTRHEFSYARAYMFWRENSDGGYPVWQTYRGLTEKRAKQIERMVESLKVVPNPAITDDDSDWYDIEEESMRLGSQAARALGRSEREHRAQPKFFSVSYFSPMRGKRVGFIRPIEAHTITDAKKQARAMVTNDSKASNFVAKEARRNPQTGGRCRYFSESIGRQCSRRAMRNGYCGTHQSKRKRNFGLIDLATNLQAADYVSKLAGGNKRKRQNPPYVSAQSHEFAIKKLEKEARQLKRDIAEGFESVDMHRRLLQIKSELSTLRWLLRRKRNPTSVSDLSKTFQGKATGAISEYKAANSAPSDLARIGKLVFFKLAGSRKQTTVSGAMVAMDKTGKLWIVGNRTPLFSRKAKPGEALDFGEIDKLCYETTKAHIEPGKRIEYVHQFGEEGGKRPRLLIDSEGMPILRGGDYKIKSEGIVN